MAHRRWWVTALVLAACGGGGCPGLSVLPQGTVTAPKMESAAALRITAQGFRVFNELIVSDGGLLSQLSGPAGLKVDIPCSTQPVDILGIGVERITIADNGRIDAGCTGESCGQMDGVCDSRDSPQQVTLRLLGITALPKGPNLVELTARTTVETGKMFISSATRGTSAFCLLSGGGPVKCGADFDTRRVQPPTAELGVELRLTIDPRWDKLLSFELAGINGSKVCGASGALPPPRCIDPNDVSVTTEGRCLICGTANFVLIKAVLLEQLTGELQKLLRTLLTSTNCLSCGEGGACPTVGTSRSVCRFTADAGTCFDSMTSACVPRLFGVEGRLALGASSLDVMLGLGGSSTSGDAGLTVGVLGALQERGVASCVAPATRPVSVAMPLPDIDRDAPASYDVGVTLSQQSLSEALFRAQQAGALCLEVGTEQVAQLESAALAALLPSLNKLTEGASVPMKLVVRPVNAPTVVLGANTVDAAGKPVEPLLRLDWQALELDLYAVVAERYARLLTVQTDVSLPLGVAPDVCGGLRPVFGSLTGALSSVTVKNAELLAEDTTALNMLVPSLLALAEPALAQGLGVIALPKVAGVPPLRVDAVKGVGAIAGTRAFNHLGIYTSFGQDAGCSMASAQLALDVIEAGAGVVVVQAPPFSEVALRIPGGLWSPWLRADGTGRVEYAHPRFWLLGEQTVEFENRSGGRVVRQVRVANSGLGVGRQEVPRQLSPGVSE